MHIGYGVTKKINDKIEILIFTFVLDIQLILLCCTLLWRIPKNAGAPIEHFPVAHWVKLLPHKQKVQTLNPAWGQLFFAHILYFLLATQVWSRIAGPTRV